MIKSCLSCMRRTNEAGIITYLLIVMMCTSLTSCFDGDGGSGGRTTENSQVQEDYAQEIKAAILEQSSKTPELKTNDEVTGKINEVINGRIRVVTQHRSDKPISENMGLNGNYPGRILQGDSVQDLSLQPIVADFKTIVLYLEADNYYDTIEVNSPTEESIKEAEEELKNRYFASGNIPAADLSIQTETAYSSEQANQKFGVTFPVPVLQGVTAGLDYSAEQSSKRNVTTFVAVQKTFKIGVSYPGFDGFFRTMPDSGFSGPPAYVSEEIYGIGIYGVISSEENSSSISKSITAGNNAITVNYTDASKILSGGASAKFIVFGGKVEDAVQVVTINSPDDFCRFFTETSSKIFGEYRYSKPLRHVLRYIHSGEVAAVQSTADYATVEYVEGLAIIVEREDDPYKADKYLKYHVQAKFPELPISPLTLTTWSSPDTGGKTFVVNPSEFKLDSNGYYCIDKILDVYGRVADTGVLKDYTSAFYVHAVINYKGQAFVKDESFSTTNWRKKVWYTINMY